MFPSYRRHIQIVYFVLFFEISPNSDNYGFTANSCTLKVCVVVVVVVVACVTALDILIVQWCCIAHCHWAWRCICSRCATNWTWTFAALINRRCLALLIISWSCWFSIGSKNEKIRIFPEERKKTKRREYDTYAGCASHVLTTLSQSSSSLAGWDLAGAADELLLLCLNHWKQKIIKNFFTKNVS